MIIGLPSTFCASDRFYVQQGRVSKPLHPVGQAQKQVSAVLSS